VEGAHETSTGGVGGTAPDSSPASSVPKPRGRALTLVGAWVGAVGAAPFVAAHRLGTRLIGEATSFRTMSETLSLIPGDLGVLIRRDAYRRTIASCGHDPSIAFGSILTHPEIVLGDDVFIGRHCVIGLATIGDDVMLADQVRVVSAKHGMRRGIAMRLQALDLERVVIGSDVWIGSGTTVLAAVAGGTVVGAGAVVTKPMSANVLAAGVPARVIRHRDHS